MGNSASKVASKVKPSRVPAFAQRPIGEQIQEAAGQRVTPMPKASETKSEAIKRDAEDPTLAKMLAQLGAVNVPGKGQGSFRSDNPMLGILAERKRAEEDAEEFGYGSRTNIRNQISAQTLSNLLDDRKDATTQKELDDLAKDYGMDPALIAELAKHINSPSVSKIELPTTDPNETPKKLAVWVDPVVSAPQLADK